MNHFPAAAMCQMAEEVASLLKVLANKDRLILLCQMSDAPKNVSELEALSGLHQPSLSQQLAVLRQANLVQTNKEGKQVYYQLTDAKTRRLLEVLCREFAETEISALNNHAK